MLMKTHTHLFNFILISETPIPKANNLKGHYRHSGMGKLNNPAKRRVLIPVIIAAVLFVLSAAHYAGATDFEQLRKESAKIKTIQAQFIQKKFMKILSKPLVSEGCFYYAAPDSFRWEYFKPLKSIVLTYKNNTKRYIASGGKMAEDKTGGAQAMKIVLNEVTGWMSGRFDQNPSFKAVIHDGENTKITLTPKDKSMAGMIEKIEIDVSKKAGTVQSVKIFEGAGNFTQINFNNVKINEVINPSVFQDVP
jgi:outer membrane lipoprotein-sorting protein